MAKRNQQANVSQSNTTQPNEANVSQDYMQELQNELGYNLIDGGITDNSYYSFMLEWYRFYHLAFKGWPHTEKIPNYLPRFPREKPDEYASRKERLWTVNFTRALTNKIITAVFSQPVTRDGYNHNPKYDMFINDCDLRGTHLNDFMAYVGRCHYVHGLCAILMDKVPASEIDTIVGNRVSPERLDVPYAAVYTAPAIVDWRFDRFRNIRCVVLRDSDDEDILEYRNSEKVKVGAQVYRVVTSRYIYVIEQRYEGTPNKPKLHLSVKRFKHILYDHKILPLVMVVNPEEMRNPFKASSGVAELVKADQAIISYMSLRDDVFHKQTFGQLVLQADSDEALTEVQVGTSSVLRYPTDTNEPSYIAPPADVVNGLNSGIESAVVQIQRITDQRFSSVGTPESAQSKEWDFHAEEFGIVAEAKVCEIAENRMFQFIYLSDKPQAKLSDKPPVTSQYGDSFDLKGAREFIDDFTALLLGMTIPAHAIKLGTKAAILKLLKNAKKDDITKIEAELDELAEQDNLGRPNLKTAVNPFDPEATVTASMEQNTRKPDPTTRDNRNKTSDDEEDEFDDES